MSRRSMKLNYKESQIIKHALQNYIKRDAEDKHIEEEKRTLNRVEKFVNEYKEYIGVDDGTKKCNECIHSEKIEIVYNDFVDFCNEGNFTIGDISLAGKCGCYQKK